MIRKASLHDYTLKDLARLARDKGVPGWHGMKKEELVRALTRAASKQPPKPLKPVAAAPVKRARPSLGRNGTANSNGRRVPAMAAPKPITRRMARVAADREKLKDLTAYVGVGNEKAVNRDRIVLMVRDPYWLQVYWEVTRASVHRAEAALAEQWHAARPTLRLLETADDGTTNTAERVVREIEIHGGVRNWYIDVQGPPQSFRVEIGYKGANGAFFLIARSNAVCTPRPGASGPKDGNWVDVAESFERVYAMSGGYANENGHTELQELFEERLRRPMGSPSSSRFGDGANRMLHRDRKFHFEVEAEIVVFGSAQPGSYVTLSGEPVKLTADGDFNTRISFPDRRQVVPIVASSGDGVEQRTVVIAVERNTKVMEPVIRETTE